MKGRPAADRRQPSRWVSFSATAISAGAVTATTCVLLAVEAGPVVGATAPATITALQWNPHWECFEKFPESCGTAVVGQLPIRLGNATDFANLVQVPAASIQAARLEGWSSIASQCSTKDLTSLMYNVRRWRTVDSPGSGATGCMVDEARPFVVQALEWLGEDAAAPVTEGFKLIVVAAHFPHFFIGEVLPSAVRSVAAATGLTTALLIADTNFDKPSDECHYPRCMWSADILRAIGVAVDNELPSPAQSTELLRTCCLDTPPGFIYTADRVVANFGSAMATKLYDEPVPSYAVGEFHKAIQGSLTVSSPKGGGASRSDWISVYM